MWLNWATYYDGQNWFGPILVPHSGNLLDNVSAVVASGDGSLVVTHPRGRFVDHGRFVYDSRIRVAPLK